MTRTVIDDLQEIHDGFNAINAAQAEYDNQMIDHEIRVKEVERIQEQLQHQGASRTLMEELQSVSGHEDALLQRGIAIESFTSFPSRTNLNVSIEVSDEIKAGLIGAAAAAGAFIVYKLVKMIYNFFKKRSSVSSSIEENKAKVDNAVKIMEEYERLQRLGSKLDEAGEKIDELKEVIKLEKEKGELTKRRLEDVNGKWTYLLESVFGKSGELRGDFLTYVGECAKELDERGPTITNIVSNLSFQLDKQDSAGLKAWIEDNIDKRLLSDPRIQNIDKDVLATKEFKDKVLDYAQKASQTTSETLASALRVAKESYQIWDELEKKTSLKDSKLNDEQFVDKLLKDLKSLQERLEKPVENIGKEYIDFVKEKLKLVKDVHVKTFQMYTLISASSSLLATQLDTFLKSTMTAFKVEEGFIRKMFTKGEIASKFAALKKLVDEGKNIDQKPSED